MNQMDNAVHDAVERVIAAAKIPVNDNDVDARLQALHPAIVDAIIDTAALPAGRDYTVRVYADPPGAYWGWNVAVNELESGELVWYGQGYIEGYAS